MDSDYILLQEENTMDYEPTQEEIREEAKFLGIAPSDEKLLWIAKEALRVSVMNTVWHRPHFLVIGSHTNIKRRRQLSITIARQAQ
mgnify:CR=1 FL=1